MSKRGAMQQLSKEGSFLGDGANQMSEDDRPKQATAAQMAARKLKPLKGRPRTAGAASSPSAQSFPPAQQSGSPFSGFGAGNGGGGGSNFNFAPTPPSGNFTFGASTGANPFNAQNPPQSSNTGTGFSTSFTFGANPPQNNQPQTGGNMFGSTTGNQSAAPAFSFGAQPSAPSTNMFGNPTATQSTNMFGNPPSAPSNGFSTSAAPSSSNLFAGNSNPPAGGSIFGTSTATPSNNIFSSISNAAPASNIFTTSSAPAKDNAATATAPPNNIFGNITSSAPSTNIFASATSSAPSGNTFGNATSAPSTTLFGNTSSEPSSNAFGGSAPTTNLFGGTTAPSTNLFSATPTTPTKDVSAAGPSTTPASNPFASNLFGQSTSGTGQQPATNIFGFPPKEAPKPAETPATSTSTETPKDTQAEAPKNIFAQPASTTKPQPASNLFGFQSESPSKPSTNLFGQPPSAGGDTPLEKEDAPAKADSAPAKNIFSSSNSSNTFGFSAQGPSASAFSQSTASAPANDAAAEQTTEKAANPFANIFSSQSKTPQFGATPPPTESSQSPFKPATEVTEKQTSEAASPKPNLFQSIAPPSSPKPSFSGNSFSTTPESSPAKAAAPPVQSPASTKAPVNASKPSTTQAEPSKPKDPQMRALARQRRLNIFVKNKLAQKSDEGDYTELFKFYITQHEDIKASIAAGQPSAMDGSSGSGTTNGAFGGSVSSPSKSNGKRKVDEELEAGAADESSKKAKSGGMFGGSQTANIFNSIVNKSTQSPRNEPAASTNLEAGPSNANVFGASASSPIKFGANASAPSAGSPLKFGATGTTSGSTTPTGSPAAKPMFNFSTQSSKSSFNEKTAEESKDASADEDNASKRKETEGSTNGGLFSRASTPGLSSGGSVLNSRQASPDARNIFGHISQDESSNKEDDDGEDDDDDAETSGQNEESGDRENEASTTPEPTASGRSDGLFGRITKDDKGAPVFGTPEQGKPASANPFGFPSSSYDSPVGSKTGPVLKTWNGDSASPIKFGSSQPAPSSSDSSSQKDAPAATSSNPFANLAGIGGTPSFKFTAPSTSTPPPASDSSPFKFNPAPATPSAGGSSVFASALGSRATTPGLSTGASENETSGAENDTGDERPTPTAEDKEAMSARTALTEQDKVTYDVLFDTAPGPSVTLMRLVDRDPAEGKVGKKWETVSKGPLRVLKHKETGKASLLLKAEPLGRAVVNARLQKGFQYKRAKAKFAMLTLAGEDGKPATQFVKFEEDEVCVKFVAVCEENKS